ncbi:MAG: hypothetical protein IPL42_16915 [Saprospiraceae bacterium]|nr:hypothetical protein [Saprospiraceae bacterium]
MCWYVCSKWGLKYENSSPRPAGSGAAGSGIWHFVDSSGLEYAVIGLSTALVIYSLEDPSKPIERARVPGVRTIWREVYTYKNHIYAVTDESSDGVIIVNMRNAPLDITHKFWTSSVTANNQTKYYHMPYSICG